MGTADGLDFGNNGAADGPFLVTFATGTFAANGITFGDVGSIADFIFNPATLPVDPLWTLSGFTFALTTLNIDSQQNNLLTLSGTGTISGNGFDVTMGDWSFSADSSNPDGGLFAWSSTTVANEPAILWLLGFGMLLVVAARRRS
ncbi:MAG: hypothetical protein HKN49_03735 [Gammaproteobacteria bacterium]|nr:hypothetical protein [Gammaproteobacteria bacterium]